MNNIQLDNPDMSGGANTMSLNEARTNYKRIGAIDEETLKYVRPPTEEEKHAVLVSKDT